MKTTTPKARKLIYQKMLDEVQRTEKGWSFCLGLMNVSRGRNLHIEKLPELMAHKPKKTYALMSLFWFSPFTPTARRKRINILKSILKEMKDV